LSAPGGTRIQRPSASAESALSETIGRSILPAAIRTGAHRPAVPSVQRRVIHAIHSLTTIALFAAISASRLRL
jgi:hypothetical protein